MKGFLNMIKLLQGDCLELMKDIPDGSVDLLVTDPPHINLKTKVVDFMLSTQAQEELILMI